MMLTFVILCDCTQQNFLRAVRARQEKDDAIRPWLKGFIDSVGLDKAEMLLQGVGKVGAVS
jgi:hypothetical protein